MAHSSRCTNARGPASKCRCACNGAAHGGQSRSLVPAARVADFGDVVAAALAQLADWLASGPGAPTQRAADQVGSAIAPAVIRALRRRGLRRYAGRADHLVCDVLAAVAWAMQSAEDAAMVTAERVVEVVLSAPRYGDGRPVIPKLAVKVAAKAAVDALGKLPFVKQYDLTLRAVRVAAITYCPDPEVHRAVVLYCLAPLEEGILAAGTSRALQDLVTRPAI